MAPTPAAPLAQLCRPQSAGGGKGYDTGRVAKNRGRRGKGKGETQTTNDVVRSPGKREKARADIKQCHIIIELLFCCYFLFDPNNNSGTCRSRDSKPEMTATERDLHVFVSYVHTTGAYPNALLRGAIVNRAYGTHKNLYIPVFLLTIFGHIYFGPP